MSSHPLAEQSKRILAYFESKEVQACDEEDCENEAVMLTGCSTSSCGISISCIVHADHELIRYGHHDCDESNLPVGRLKNLLCFRQDRLDDAAFRKQIGQFGSLLKSEAKSKSSCASCDKPSTLVCWDGVRTPCTICFDCYFPEPDNPIDFIVVHIKRSVQMCRGDDVKEIKKLKD